MNILGELGSLYMLILILLLIIGFGLVGWRFVTYISENIQQSINNKKEILRINKIDAFRWINVALISFIGILVSIMILFVIKPVLI